MDNKIELRSINELLGMNFYIPAYQRGYRWTTQQVKDLLDDILEFKERKKEGFYCIQPLVVKRSIPDAKINDFKTGLETIKINASKQTLVEQTEKLIIDNTQWEVIDGQQRLTTIFIILQHLNPDNKYTLEYQTRNKSKSFLEEINESEKKDNIDFYHIAEAKKVIVTWFNERAVDFKTSFLKTLLKDVQFIWYESVDEDPVNVFTRLNVGKISLTNAELIKALFLNKSNFQGSNQRIRLQQNEIAIDWDRIEYSLQNDEFWLFLHEVGYDKPTRIDFIFDLMVEKDILKLKLPDDQNKTIGNDEYMTFRYFYEWFKIKKDKYLDILECWNEVKTIFNTFQEWFNDIELYHYVGFLVEYEIRVKFILDEWIKPDRTKSQFINDYIIPQIKGKLVSCSNLYKQYEENGSPKTQCRPILLLHNIQTVITQNKTLTENNKYELPVFYKFPFHLFKKETWNVEHIDSNTENSLEKINAQKEWLKASYEFVGSDATITISETNESNSETKEVNLKEAIKSFIDNSGSKLEFDTLRVKVIENTTSQQYRLDEKEKNQLWNFALLDESTNKGYGNAIFPAKRRCIIGKDKGKKILVNAKLEYVEIKGAIAFIPPCTKNIFLKYYNPTTNNLREWDKTDAEAYLNNINDTLLKFLK